MRKLFITSAVFLVLFTSGAAAQTTIHGKLLSVDGSILPKTVISIHQDSPRDIFSEYDDIYAGADGKYRFELHEPGIYNITFRGIYHRPFTIPFLVIDQPSIEMDVLLLPAYFNDGRYFSNEEYLHWIRVVGNFNNYDYHTGIPFSENEDGSISAFIPVTSDTVRYQVRGLGYGWGGHAPLPLADKYQIRDDRSFESVLYNNLPADSLEIRYIPGETIPFERKLPSARQEWLNASGFVNFKSSEDRHWTEPISLMHVIGTSIPFIERDLTSGLAEDEQVHYLNKFYSIESAEHLLEVKQRFLMNLDNPDIHPRQREILFLGYAALIYQIEISKLRLEYIMNDSEERLSSNRKKGIEVVLNRLDETTIDKEILMQISEQVVPVHPLWSRAQMLPQFLLQAIDGEHNFIEYFTEIVKHHPAELAVERVISALVRELAEDYETVEDMEVYQIVVERFGEGEVARRAHDAFRAPMNGADFPFFR